MAFYEFYVFVSAIRKNIFQKALDKIGNIDYNNGKLQRRHLLCIKRLERGY